MTINGKGLHVWAARKTASARRSNAIASPLKKDFRHRKADEEKRREFLEVKSVYEARLHPFVYIDESGFRKDISRPYVHHAGKNAQGYPDGAKHRPALSVPCAALCHLLSLPLDCSIDSDVFGVMDKKVFFSRLTF